MNHPLQKYIPINNVSNIIYSYIPEGLFLKYTNNQALIEYKNKSPNEIIKYFELNKDINLFLLDLIKIENVETILKKCNKEIYDDNYEHYDYEEIDLF